jgi:hypothetical protein
MIMKSNPKFTKAKFKEVWGSGFYRYLKASYGQLVEKFGEPHDCTKEGEWRSGDSKVRVEWAFKTGSVKKPTIVTIYEYKSDQPIREITTWHIGSRGKRELVDQFLKSHFADVEIEDKGI